MITLRYDRKNPCGKLETELSITILHDLDAIDLVNELRTFMMAIGYHADTVRMVLPSGDELESIRDAND